MLLSFHCLLGRNDILDQRVHHMHVPEGSIVTRGCKVWQTLYTVHLGFFPFLDWLPL